METDLPGQEAKELYDARARPLAGLFLVNKKLKWKGLENKLEQGANIIVANHPGAGKDIASLIASYKRQLFFLANKELFGRQDFDKLIKDHCNYLCKRFFSVLGEAAGPNMNFLLNVPRGLATKYVSSKISKVGTIPINIRGNNGYDYKQAVESYLLHGFGVVFPQYNHARKVSQHAPDNKEIREFRYGAPKTAYDMLEKHGVDVPVTPVSIKGLNESWFRPNAELKLSFGKPMYVSEHASDKKSVQESVADFKEALEKRVVELYNESG